MAKNNKKQKPSRAQKASHTNADIIIEAALACTLKSTWDQMSMAGLAKKTKLSLTSVQQQFPNKDALIGALPLYFDHRLEKIFKKTAPTGSEHDRLFEVIISRFELINHHRQSFLNLLDYLKGKPPLLLRLVPSLYQSIQKTLDLAKITPHPQHRRTLMALGLMGISSATFFAWTRDQSHDLSKTMATLNRLLLQGEKLLALPIWPKN